MKILTLSLIVLGLTLTARADLSKDPKAQEAMKAWMEFGTPGEAHKVLSDLKGKWKYTSKWWQAPGAKADESTGTTTMTLMLGGRFLKQETRGKSMGKAFEGLGILGFDKVKQQYESFWFDNMSTGVARGVGTFDTATRTFKETGEFSDPTVEDKKRTYRSEWKLIDKKSMLFEMYSKSPDGQEFKMMEMAYKRTK